MTEPAAAPVEGDHARRGQVLQVRGGDLVQPLRRDGASRRGGHLFAEDPDDGHPLVRLRRGAGGDGAALCIPVPVEQGGRRGERRRARRIGSAFEQQVQVLGKPQDLQLAVSERSRIESRSPASVSSTSRRSSSDTSIRASAAGRSRRRPGSLRQSKARQTTTVWIAVRGRIPRASCINSSRRPPLPEPPPDGSALVSTWSTIRTQARPAARAASASTRTGDSSRSRWRPRSAAVVAVTTWSSRNASTGMPRARAASTTSTTQAVLPAPAPPGQDALARRFFQTRLQRRRRLPRQHRAPNQSPARAVQVPVRRTHHRGARPAGFVQAAGPEATPGESLDDLPAGQRALPGAFHDRQQPRDHRAGVRAEERSQPPAHLLLELPLADRPDLDPPQPVECGRRFADPAAEQPREPFPAGAGRQPLAFECVRRVGARRRRAGAGELRDGAA